MRLYGRCCVKIFNPFFCLFQGNMENNNTNLNLELLKATKSNIPVNPKILDSVQPTIEINPIVSKSADISINSSVTTTGTTTVYTVPTGHVFYLNSAYLTVNCDSSSDNSQCTLSYSMEGKSYTIIAFYKATGALYKDNQVSFPRPLRLTGGTTIRLYTSFAAGNVTMVTNITGFIEKEYG